MLYPCVIWVIIRGLILKLYKEDIKKIGLKTSHLNGNTTFLCSIDNAGIQSILLREVLSLFGDYKIVRNFKTRVGMRLYVEYETDLPNEIFQSVR